MEPWATRYPDRFRIIRYEQLVLDPQAVLGPVLGDLGERFESTQLNPDIPSGVVLARSLAWKGQALQAVDAGRIGYRASEAGRAELAELQRCLGTDLRRHGYA